jgi:glycosyltransferase involved in cell wall biosynthesis
MKVLHIIPDLEYGNAARQLSWLAPALNEFAIQCRVCVLSGHGPLAQSLAQVPVDYLDWNRRVDLRPFWQLRRIFSSFEPDIIHCWRLESLRTLMASCLFSLKGTKVIVSLFSGDASSSEAWRWLDQRLLRHVDRVVVQWPTEIEQWRSLGLSPEKLIQIPPGVGSCPISNASQESELDSRLPSKSRTILCVGPLKPSKGIKDAVWAFHIVGFLYTDLHLVLVGDGPERERLSRLAGSLFPERIISLPSHEENGRTLARADVVWVPSVKPRGFNVALEAMAAGKPVVASRLPGLMDIIQDGETGVLIDAGDQVSLARQTRKLLDDPDRRRQMGEAGRRRVQEHFSLNSLAQAYTKLYEVITQAPAKKT